MGQWRSCEPIPECRHRRSGGRIMSRAARSRRGWFIRPDPPAYRRRGQSRVRGPLIGVDLRKCGWAGGPVKTVSLEMALMSLLAIDRAAQASPIGLGPFCGSAATVGHIRRSPHWGGGLLPNRGAAWLAGAARVATAFSSGRFAPAWAGGAPTVGTRCVPRSSRDWEGHWGGAGPECAKPARPSFRRAWLLTVSATRGRHSVCTHRRVSTPGSGVRQIAPVPDHFVYRCGAGAPMGSDPWPQPRHDVGAGASAGARAAAVLRPLDVDEPHRVDVWAVCRTVRRER